MPSATSNDPNVTFFDLGAIVIAGPQGARLRPGTRRRLARDGRLGILTNAPGGLGRRGIEQTLVALGIDGLFARDLVIDAAVLPAPLPDRRAFAVAAALAGVELGACRFVAVRRDLLAAARSAGMVIESAAGRAEDPARRARGSTGARISRRSPAGPGARWPQAGCGTRASPDWR